MAYTAWSVSFGEQPSAAKWNILGTNDASFADGTGISAGAITPEKLVASTGTSWPYTTWTPTVSADGGTPDNGNAIITAYYKQVGKLVSGFFIYALGSTTNFGTGNFYFSLPVTARSVWNSGSGVTNNPFIGGVHMVDSAVQEYGGWIVLKSATTMAFVYNDVSASGRIRYASGSASQPWAWGNGDIASGSFVYEAA